MHKGSRSGKWLRKAGGLFPLTPFRARRAVSVTSVVQNAVLYIGIENAFWVKKPCRKAKDSFNGLKRKSALDRHATVHWMDMTASILLKFMRPLDGQTRFNPIETCVSMGWTQRPPPHAGNLSPGIAAVSPAPRPNAHIIPKPPRPNQARRFVLFPKCPELQPSTCKRVNSRHPTIYLTGVQVF